jgi:phosphocarrier protein FPr/phosphocarrier protein
MAGNPEAIPILLGLGLRSLSLSPYMIPKIKKIIRSVSISACEAHLKKILEYSSTLEVIEATQKFYKNHISKSELLI